MSPCENESADRIADFFVRGVIGEPVGEETYYARLLPAKLEELITRHRISRAPDDTVPASVDVGDRVFAAAVALLCELGVYCKDTERLIRFSRDDVKSGLGRAPAGFVQGSGAQSVELRSRGLNDSRIPNVDGGPMGIPLSRDAFVPCLRANVIEGVHGVALGDLAHEPFAPPTSASEMEFFAARQALLDEGKPGLSILGALSCDGKGLPSELLVSAKRRVVDRVMAQAAPRLKLDFEFVSKAHAAARTDLGLVARSGVMPDGYASSAVGWAICTVAEALAAFVVLDPLVFAFCPLSASSNAASARVPIWVAAVAHLAFVASGYDVVTGGIVVGAAGPCTEMLAFEIAAQAIAATACGSADFLCAVGNGALIVDHASGLEARILGETARAAVGMSIDDAREVVTNLVSAYEAELERGDVPFGKSFFECHDAASLRPTDDVDAWWGRCREALREHGVPL